MEADADVASIKTRMTRVGKKNKKKTADDNEDATSFKTYKMDKYNNVADDEAPI